MATRLFLSSADSSDHSDHISARQGDYRYVNEDELVPKAAPHFLAKHVADHLDMRTHRVTNLAPAAEVSDAVTLAQLRAGRSMKRGTLASPDGIRLFVLFKCTNCVLLSLLVKRTVYDEEAPFAYAVNQQVNAHLVQLGGSCVVFFPYGKSSALNARSLTRRTRSRSWPTRTSPSRSSRARTSCSCAESRTACGSEGIKKQRQ